MIERFQKSMKEKDQGFTLVELLVVIVIVGILAGIAIPLFLNQRQKGVDAGVQSDLKAAATLQETYYTDELTYANQTALEAVDGFIETDENVIEVVAATDDGFCLRGSSPKGSREGTAGDADYYWYDSQAGGLELDDLRPSGVCAAPVTP